MSCSFCSLLQFRSEGTKEPQRCHAIPLAVTACALAAIALGIVSLGIHQQWWTVGTFSTLSQPGLIALMSTGGAGLALFAAVAVANCRKGDAPSEESTWIIPSKEIASWNKGCCFLVQSKEGNNWALGIVNDDGGCEIQTEELRLDSTTSVRLNNIPHNLRMFIVGAYQAAHPGRKYQVYKGGPQCAPD